MRWFEHSCRSFVILFAPTAGSTTDVVWMIRASRSVPRLRRTIGRRQTHQRPPNPLALPLNQTWSEHIMAQGTPLTAQAESCLAKFRAYKAPPDRFKATAKNRASVLVLLFSRSDGELHVVLTTRSLNLRTHAGDVALPGGKFA